MKHPLYSHLAFTLIEVIVALGVFSTIIVGSTALFHYYSSGIAEMQQSVQAEILAQNTLDLTESIIKNSSDWKNHLQGNPLSGNFYLQFNGNIYTLTASTGILTSSASSLFSLPPKEGESKFYKKITISEIGNKLYQIESDICFQECLFHTKLYRISSLQ